MMENVFREVDVVRKSEEMICKLEFYLGIFSLEHFLEGNRLNMISHCSHNGSREEISSKGRFCCVLKCCGFVTSDFLWCGWRCYPELCVFPERDCAVTIWFLIKQSLIQIDMLFN